MGGPIGGVGGAAIGAMATFAPPFLINEFIHGSDEAAESQEQLKEKVDAVSTSIENAGITTEKVAESTRNASEAMGGLGATAESAVEKGINPLTSKTEELASNFEGVEGQVSQAKETLGTIEGTMGNVANKTSSLNQEVLDLKDTNSDLVGTQEQVMKSVDDAGAAMENAQGTTKQLAEETKQASEVLSGLGVFAADVAANINDAFSDLIFKSLKGNFDNLSDIWDSALDSMLESFSQFLATVISNPR